MGKRDVICGSNAGVSQSRERPDRSCSSPWQTRLGLRMAQRLPAVGQVSTESSHLCASTVPGARLTGEQHQQVASSRGSPSCVQRETSREDAQSQWNKGSESVCHGDDLRGGDVGSGTRS